MSKSLDHLQMYGNEEVYKQVKTNAEFSEKRENLIADLKTIKEEHGWDKEKCHVMADGLLLAYINDLAITLAFEEIDKWYA